MNNKVIALTLIVGTVVSIGGRQLFTPLSLTWDERQYLHDDKAGGKWDKVDRTGRAWTFDIWGAGYNRYADTAYTCSGNCSCQVPLTTLILGKADFYLREIFYNSTTNITNNPWVNVAKLKPRVEYSEQGAYVGAQWSTDVKFLSDRTFRFGIRGNMPAKMIKVERCYSSVDADGELTGKADLAKYSREEVVAGHAIDSWAYRYDLVNSLVINNTTNEKLIKYGAGGDHIIAMSGVNVTDLPLPGKVVNVKGGIDDNVTIPFGAIRANTGPALAADGSGVASGSRAYFSGAVDYVTLNTTPANQDKLWIVPTTDDTGDILTQAGTVKTAIEAALAHVQDTVTEYFEDKSLDLNTQKNMGAGDLLLQMFLQRNWHDKKIFTEAQFGVVFPTGKKACNTLAPFSMPLGNNGHYEVECGLDLGWNACKWAALQAGFSYHWALKAIESVAAPFEGACVKNFGPCVRANTSWNYLLTDLNLTLIEPTKHNFGMNAAYEFYYKPCDKICLCSSQAVDLEGDTYDLCANNLTWLTKTRSHKVKAEMFFNKSTGSIFGGFDYIFAGRNVPKEIGWHLGLLIEF